MDVLGPATACRWRLGAGWSEIELDAVSASAALAAATRHVPELLEEGSHTHDTSHTHDPTAVSFTKVIALSSTSFSTSGTVAKAFYSMPEITAKAVAGGLVEAYMDLDSGGSAWVPLPDTIQFSDLVVSTVSYLYRQGMFEVLVTSPDPSTVAGTVLAINGYRVKVVILSAP